MVAILCGHVLPGTWLAMEDPAFTRALDHQQGGLAMFLLLAVITMSCLFHFAFHGIKVKT